MVTCPKGVTEYCSEAWDWNERLCHFPWQEQEGSLCQQLLFVCGEQPEFLPRAWGAQKQTQQLSSISVFGTSEELCQSEELCWCHHSSHLFSLLGFAWIPTWKLKLPENASMMLEGLEVSWPRAETLLLG